MRGTIKRMYVPCFSEYGAEDEHVLDVYVYKVLILIADVCIIHF